MCNKSIAAAGIKGHSKSIVLGGGQVLYPINEANIPELTDVLQQYVRRCENAAYERGYAKALSNVRTTIGLK